MAKVLVWIGAFSDHWRIYDPRPGDGWVAADVLETGDDGSLKVQRCDNANHTAWVKFEHWKEIAEEA